MFRTRVTKYARWLILVSVLLLMLSSLFFACNADNGEGPIYREKEGGEDNDPKKGDSPSAMIIHSPSLYSLTGSLT